MESSSCGSPSIPPSPPSTPPPVFDDQATFLADVTLPDHTLVTPGTSLVKTWRVRNSGTTDWNGYKLIFVSGDQMSAPSSVDIPDTAAGAEREISIPIIAPQTSARGDWQIVSPSGTWVRYGQLWVILDVPGTNPVTGSDVDLDCVNNTCYATVAPGQTFRPTIRATVNSGQLQESRGDMLRHKDGDLFGAWPHVAVQGTVNEGQSYDFTFYADNPIHAPSQEGTYENTWQIWRNGNWAGEEFTLRFTVSQSGGGNRPPNRPTLTGPGDWGVYQGEQVILTAQHNGDPDGDAVNEYYFDLRGTSPRNSGWIASNTWSPSGLPYDGYEWQVKVRDQHGNESDWSEQTWHFNVLNNDPEIYSFYSTTCRDAWGGAEKLCFCAKTNAGTLKLMINTASDGSTNGEWRGINELGVPEYRCDTDDDRPPNLDPLPYEDGNHVVRLYARREGGWANAAYQDITINFPMGRKPNTPILRLPIARSYVNSLDVHFDWEESLRVNDTDAYRLELSDVADFSHLLLDQSFDKGITAYDHTFSTDYETVYLRVTATGPHGTNQNTWRFYIDLDAPDSAITPLPAVTTDTKFTVNWSGSDARSGLRWYHVQVRDTSRPGGVWEDWLVNTTKEADVFQGQPGHTYAFRVRAMDDIGNWEAWPTGDTGDTYTLVDPSAAQATAWWDANYAYKRNLVILNNDSDTMPADFPIHIHFDDTTVPTAAEIYNASLAATKGEDVRVVYDNQTELHRSVQHFTADQIDIWFPLQGGLAGGQTDSGSYQVYYGYAGASNPPADINTVFLPKTDANTMLLAHFQEGTGSTVQDSSGRAHNGTFEGAGWTDGFLGVAGLFDGTDSVVNFSNHSDFNVGAMTLETWILVTENTGNHERFFDKATYRFNVSGSRQPQFGAFGNEVSGACPDLELNTWYHVAATYNGTDRGRIYINGQMCSERIESHTPYHQDVPLLVGTEQHADAPHFPGYLQHIRVSNIERTDFPYAQVNIPPSVEAGALVDPPTAGSPDLALLNLTTYPNPGGGLLVMALVENQGDAPTQNNFYTDLYADDLPGGAGEYGFQFWVNSPIVAGTQVTLTTVITELTSLGGRLARTQASPGSEVTATLYSQVDSAGVISETDNLNNISSGIDICLASADVYESDDAVADATLITLDQTQSHNFDSLADRDWVKFDAQSGTAYTLRTSDLDSGADTYLYLYASDGVSLTLLAANDDYGGSLASQIDWTAPTTDTYYLLVQHWNPNVGGCGTGYKLTLKEQVQSQMIFLPLVLRK